MKRKLLLAAVVMLMFTGCGQKNTTDTEATTPAFKEPTRSGDLNDITVTADDAENDTDPAETSAEELVIDPAVDSAADSAAASSAAEPATEAVTETTATAVETAATTPVNVAGATWLTLPTEQILDYTTVDYEYAALTDVREAFIAQVCAEKTNPVVSITTQDGVAVTSKDYYVASVVDVFNCDASYELSAANAGVKVRGNASAKGDEKPLRIKFDKKQSMLGLHDGKKYKSWVLLRTYWGLVHDYLAFKLADPIFGGKYYSSDGILVNLYVNQQYKGVFLLCEQNQVANDRFDVNEAKNNDTSLNIGYLLEMDNYPDANEHPYFYVHSSYWTLSDVFGVTRQILARAYSIKSDIYTEEQKTFIMNYTNNLFIIMYNAAQNGVAYGFDENYNLVERPDLTPYQAVDAVIDMESVADMVILEELVHNLDVGAGSVFIAIDFSAGSVYKKATFCGPWDFSWAYEDETTGQYYACTFQAEQSWGDNSNYWYVMAMKFPEFQALLSTRWKQIGADNIIAVADAVAATADNYRSDLGDLSWHVDSSKNLVKFVKERAAWLDSIWNIQ